MHSSTDPANAKAADSRRSFFSRHSSIFGRGRRACSDPWSPKT